MSLRAHAEQYPCPLCRAQAGESCRTTRGALTDDSHAVRAAGVRAAYGEGYGIGFNAGYDAARRERQEVPR